MRVGAIVGLTGDGGSRPAILAGFPYREDDDISAAILYAARSRAYRDLRVA